ncbi:MAG: CoB--CoM heterodisulfide reductase iron-sulfur subunit A family protein [Magnetovibrio sp.]|nr:CoB--CoM heterodisulfide reductase iron-sulfur subunit A family protein [Magnetovibrio sp.]
MGVESQTILVVGGGIAGITAAVEAAETGYEVVLLEKEPSLGGRVTKLNRYFPKLCHPTCGLEINYQRIKKTPRINVMTMSTVAAVSGEKGNFTVSVKRAPRFVNANCTACGECTKATSIEISNDFNYGLDTLKGAYLPHEHAFPMRYVIAPEAIKADGEAIKAACKYDAIDLDDAGETFDLNIGAIIWATGWQPYDANKLTMYGYEMADVINNVEMERLASHDGPTKGKILRPSNGEEPKKIALVQCAGSRDYNHLPYCSRICCLGSLKHAAYIREQYADAEVDIYYIDIRAHDKLESFYVKLKNDPQVNFIKSKPARIEADENGNPVICGEDTISRDVYATPYDLVVLATGMEPSTVCGKPPVEIEEDEYGFLVPKAGEVDGQISAGVASGPLDVSMSVQSATAAALKAIQAVRSNS